MIVGAGFAGASTAFHLSTDQSLRILVLEKEKVAGVHASGRNAALGRQITSSHLTTEFTVRGLSWLAHSTDLLNVTGAYYPTGSSESASKMLQAADRFGVEARGVSEATVYEHWEELRGLPLSDVVFVPGDGVIDVHGLLQFYLQEAISKNVTVRYNTEVASIDETRLQLADRTVIEATTIVNAAGPWAGTLANKERRLIPRRRHLFVSSKGAAPTRPFVWNVGENEYYLRDEGTGLLLCPCDELEMPPCDVRPASDAKALLAEKFKSSKPLTEKKIKAHWAGLRTFTPNREFLIEWDRDVENLFWVAGLGGHGVTASYAVGQTAAARIMKRHRNQFA